jgi:prepilin signal peptidase PulO-like enzyme (type II secretory pathway)
MPPMVPASMTIPSVPFQPFLMTGVITASLLTDLVVAPLLEVRS